MLVERDVAARVLERALSRGGDFAELFCEERRGFTLSIDESRVERPQSGSERGAGIRVIDGEVTRLRARRWARRGGPAARRRRAGAAPSAAIRASLWP